MNKMDKAMVTQLRLLSEEHNLPSIDLIADRMQQLAELDLRLSLIPPFLRKV